MSQVKTRDRDRSHIKITECIFVYGGLFLGVMGALFIFVFRHWDFGPPNVIAGSILVGIGALAGCILKIYDRVKALEQKLNNLDQSSKNPE